VPAEEFLKPEQTITDKDILNGNHITDLKLKIDKSSGLPATSSTLPELIEEKTYPQIHSILHFIDKNNPLGETNGQNDSQYINWEQSILNWVSKLENGYLYNQNPISTEP
jgi:NifU-like protein involved in Fe-S cluster formation